MSACSCCVVFRCVYDAKPLIEWRAFATVAPMHIYIIFWVWCKMPLRTMPWNSGSRQKLTESAVAQNSVCSFVCEDKCRKKTLQPFTMETNEKWKSAHTMSNVFCSFKRILPQILLIFSLRLYSLSGSLCSSVCCCSIYIFLSFALFIRSSRLRCVKWSNCNIISDFVVFFPRLINYQEFLLILFLMQHCLWLGQYFVLSLQDT